MKDVNVVKESVLKTGSNNGRTWTLYKYTCEDGFEFTTFTQHNLGTMKIDVEKNVSGKYENFQEVKPRKANPEIEQVLTALSIINGKLDTILTWKK